MTDQTDRIKQMAQEAGASFDPTFESVGDNPAFIMSPDELAKFAALVAEDCARVVDDEIVRLQKCMESYSTIGLVAQEQACQYLHYQIRARYAIAKPPEAG